METRGLTKHFKDVRAVDGIDLHVARGELVALLGRDVRLRIGYIGQGNGAGHSQRGRDELISQGRSYGLSARDAAAGPAS